MKNFKRFSITAVPAVLSTMSLAVSAANLSCSDVDEYFCDDFSDGDTSNWSLMPSTNNSLVPNGQFDVVSDDGNNVLRYTVGDTGGVVALSAADVLSNVPSGDYFVEAKFRPRKNSNTSSKQLYILGRYQDGNNWYAAALNVQNSTSTTQIEFAVMKDGALSRPVQKKFVIEQGTAGELDGQWYDLRLSMVGDKLTVYINGDEIISTTDSSFSDIGQIGIWSKNKAFEVDDIVVGDPNNLPASLTFDPSGDATYVADAGDAAKVYTVSAKKSDGTADTFTATSGDTSIVSADVNGDQLTLTPLAEGETTVTVTTGSGRTKLINVSLNPEFIMPDATYSFTDQLLPAANETSAYEDSVLKVTFDSAPELGKGSIRIFDAADDSIVDDIALVGETDSIGTGGNTRELNVNSVRVVGNQLIVTPHSNKLELGKTYYVAIPEAVIGNDVKLAGQAFEGIGKSSQWTFTTRAAKPDASKTKLTVDDDGNDADFRSIQSAINFISDNLAADTASTILVKEGVYYEPLYIYQRNNLTIKGEGQDVSIIRYKNNESLNSGSSGRPLILAKNSDMLTFEDITIHNTTLIGDGHQAEALYFNSNSGRMIAKNTSFLSEQDTLLVKGWVWFYQSLISGNVDFIWGYPKAALFEESTIQSRADSRGKTTGYILQARVANEADKGFVFLNSTLSRASADGYDVADDAIYLARSGGCDGCFDNVTFVNTKMDSHIKTVGWYNSPLPTPETATGSSGWREYNSMDLNGNSLDVSGRLSNSYQMAEADVLNDYCSRSQVFSAYNDGAGWDPMPSNASDCNGVIAQPEINLDAEAVDNATVSLNWSIDNADIDLLAVYRDTDDDPTGRTRIAALPVSQTSYQDTDVTAGETYYYWVKVRREGDAEVFNSSAIKAEVPLLNTPVISLSAKTSGSGVTLNWSVEKSDISELSIYRDTDSNPEGRTRLSVLPVSATTYTDKSAKAGTTYYYWVKVRRTEDSANFNSAAVSATP